MNNRKAKKILTKNRSILAEDPQDLFQNEKEILNKDFFFEGSNGKGILLIHGWTATPYELRRLGTFLNENGYGVHAPLLRGHGSIPKDLEGVRWADWVADLEKEVKEMQKKYSRVYVGGTSIGSNLAILLAKNNLEIAGLVLMAMPYKIKLESLMAITGRLLEKVHPYGKKYYPPTFGSANTITRLISYQSYPIKSAFEVLDLVKETRKVISDIKQPSFLLQSLSDHVIAKNSLEEIYSIIGSSIKKKKYIKRAYHTFISDIKNENIFKDIFNFLEEN